MQANLSSLVIIAFIIILFLYLTDYFNKEKIMNKLLYIFVCMLSVSIVWNNVAAAKNQNDDVSNVQYHDNNSLSKKMHEKNKEHKDNADKHNLKALKKNAKNYSDRWLANKIGDINEDFDEAVYKIGKTSMPQELKNLLIKQAQENKSLALKQAEEVNNQLKEQSLAREKFHEQFMNEKMNKKVIKRIDEIIK